MKRIGLAVLGAAMFGACGGNGSTEPPAASVAGTYALRTVNGHAVPYVATDVQGFRAEVLGGTLTLGADGRCSVASETRTTVNGSSHVERAATPCTYTGGPPSDGRAELVLEAGGLAHHASWHDGEVTLQAGVGIAGDDLVLVYRR